MKELHSEILAKKYKNYQSNNGDIMSLKERIREVRKSKRLTQKMFGRRLDIKQPQLSRYERGISEPDYDTIKKFHTVYNVNLNWLFSGRGNMFNATNPDLPDTPDLYDGHSDTNEIVKPTDNKIDEKNPELINIIDDNKLETLKIES